MADQPDLLQLLDQLVAEVQRLHMAQTVQRSAWLLTVRLASRGQLQPQALANDLRTMGKAQTDPDWQSGHEALAADLQTLGGQL